MLAIVSATCPAAGLMRAMRGTCCQLVQSKPPHTCTPSGMRSIFTASV